jgi:putative SOS response-associated peptidase YedK
MCGRYVSPDRAAIERAWQIVRSDGNPFALRYNVQPTTIVPVLVLEPGGLALRAARWGLVPRWWKEAKPPKFTFNARLEEAAAKPMWRDPVRRGRCLVPAMGWYEWRGVERTDPRTGEIALVKEPHYIRRADGRLFCFAGLMADGAQPQAGQPQLTCAILTTDSAGPVAEVHSRMPVVLPDDAHAEWLDPALVDSARVTGIARERPVPGEFVHYVVRKLVNFAKNEGPGLIEPAAQA